MLLEHRKSQNEQVEDEQKLSDVFMKTLGYTGRYGFIDNEYRLDVLIMTREKLSLIKAANMDISDWTVLSSIGEKLLSLQAQRY